MPHPRPPTTHPANLARLDRLLLSTFAMMLFVAWFFEPWVVYLCGWDGLESAACQRTLTGRLWLFYAKRFDPIFLDLPLWLRIVCSLGTICFGPFYAASVYAFSRGQQLSRWYRVLALPMAGALLSPTPTHAPPTPTHYPPTPTHAHPLPTHAHPAPTTPRTPTPTRHPPTHTHPHPPTPTHYPPTPTRSQHGSRRAGGAELSQNLLR